MVLFSVISQIPAVPENAPWFVTLGIGLLWGITKWQETRSKKDIAKIGADSKDLEKLRLSLKGAMEQMKELSSELDVTQKKLDNVKVAFSVIYGTLERILRESDNPESVEMLSKIKELIDG